MTPEQKFKDAGKNGKEYRGAPFWSWNDDLEPEELRRQIRSMCESGMGGFFMHTRTGLITPYMSEEYLELHDACIDEARKLGMGAWLYDEDCWPSGNAGDMSPARGPEYRLKQLACDVVPGGSEAGENVLAVFKAKRERREKRDSPPASLGTVPFFAGADRSSVEEMKNASANQEFLVFRMRIGDYVDMLWPEAIANFIDVTHEQFKKRFKADFGGVIPGIFTDEPTYGWGPAWTRRFPEEFRQRRGYDLVECLPSLFFEIGDFNRARYGYYRTAMELYVEAFSKQVGEWCEREGLPLTGHQVCEEALSMQTHTIGAAMPHYEYMQIPGIDVVAPWLRDPIFPKQVSSVAHQLGKERVLSETFGCGGWNMSLEQQKWIGEWQYALGVNLMCQHLCLYSLRGCRKRDYPPSIFYQQPWWPDYKMFEDHFARLAAALTSGKHIADVLIVHPIESTWAIYDPNKTWMQDKLNDEFMKTSDTFVEAHLDYDYGDESLMEKYARVEGDRFIVGQCEYRLVVLPSMRSIRRNTLKLVADFVANGGKALVIGNLPWMVEGVKSDEPAKVLGSLPIVANEFKAIKAAALAAIEPRVVVTDQSGRDAGKILMNHRDLGGKQLFFFANTDRVTGCDAKVAIPGKGLAEEWDLDTGDIKPVPCKVEKGRTTVSLWFAPVGSHVISFDPAKEPVIGEADKPRVVGEIELDGAWSIARKDWNAVTLDYCRYKLGDGEWSEPTHTIHLVDRLAEVRKETPLALRFTFKTDFKLDKPGGITLVMEIPEKFDIAVNGQRIEYTDCGWWADISFKKIPIGRLVKSGENVIEIRCDDYVGLRARQERIKELDLHSYLGRAYTNPPPGVKDPIILPFKGEVTEIQRKVNELKYGIELESCYIIGDFDVVRDGSGFALTDSADTVEASDFVEQGYPFFRGSVVCSKVVGVAKKPGERLILDFGDAIGAIVTKVRVNGKDAGRLAWRPLELDVTDLLIDGANTIEVELINSCRNLLGPHHTLENQRIGVGARTFKGMSIWEGIYTEGDRFFWGDPDDEVKVDWRDEYVFASFGLLSAPRLRRTVRERQPFVSHACTCAREA